jgi:hypothetical protein
MLINQTQFIKAITILMLCVSAFFVAAVNANANVNTHKNTNILNAYLPETCNQTGLYQQQKSIAGISKQLETSGSFLFACEKGLLWYASAPLNEALVYAVQKQLGKMLNHLIGGDHRYIEKTFLVAQTDAGVRLTPRNKRMEKFLRAIDIARTADAVSIHMLHQGEEFTAIKVYQLKALTSTSFEQCQQLAPEEAPSFSIACQHLFQL